MQGPPVLPNNGKQLFSYLAFELKQFLLDCFHIWNVNLDGWEDRCHVSMIIKWPQTPPNIKINKMVSQCGPYIWKPVVNFSYCWTYISSVMRCSCPKHWCEIYCKIFLVPGSIFIIKTTKMFKPTWGRKGVGLKDILYRTCLWVPLDRCLGVPHPLYWFRATGGNICSCGRPINLV